MMVRYPTNKDIRSFNSKFSSAWPTMVETVATKGSSMGPKVMETGDFHRHMGREGNLEHLKICDVSQETELMVPVYAEHQGRRIDRVVRPWNGMSYRRDHNGGILETWIVNKLPQQEAGLARSLILQHQPIVEEIQWGRVDSGAYLFFSLPVSMPVTVRHDDFFDSTDMGDLVPTGVQRFCIALPSESLDTRNKCVRMLYEVGSISRTIDVLLDFSQTYKSDIDHYR